MPASISPRGKLIHVVAWASVSLIVVGVDYAVGPVIQFPVLFIIPVSLAAWFNGGLWGVGLAIALPLVRLYLTTIADTPWAFTDSAINAAIRIGVLAGFAWLIDRTAMQTAALRRRVGLLEGLLPLCAICRRIRVEKKGWEPLEGYVLSHAKEQFAQQVCPECASKHHDTFDRR